MTKAFISGFLLCWSLLACFLLLADAKDWITIFEDWAGWIACFPLLIVGYPFHFIFAILIYFPWRNVWRPVSKERFEEVFQGDKVAYWKLGKRFCVCFDPEAKKFWNKVFFVRIKKED